MRRLIYESYSLHQREMFRKYEFLCHLHLHFFEIILAKFVLLMLQHWHQKFSPVSGLKKHCQVAKLATLAIVLLLC